MSQAVGGSLALGSLALRFKILICFYSGEYRTYFQIGVNYGVSESSSYKHIVWVENVLIKIVVDSGDQGLQKIHTNTMLPKKNTKKKPLTKDDKNHNHLLAHLGC